MGASAWLRSLTLVFALVDGFHQPRHRRARCVRRSMIREDFRLLVGDAGVIVAAGATQKLVEALQAGDSLWSPVVASDLDALPALFTSSGVWLLCCTWRRGNHHTLCSMAWRLTIGSLVDCYTGLIPATARGVYDNAVDETASERALDAAVNAGQLRVLYELAMLAVVQTPISVLDVSIGIFDVVAYLTAWRAFYAWRFQGF